MPGWEDTKYSQANPPRHPSKDLEGGAEMIYLLILAVPGLLGVGWVLGMWTRKRSNLWCPVDGSKLICGRCVSAGAHWLGSPANIAHGVSFVDGGDAA